MTDHEFSNEEARDRLTRRQVLHGALAGGAMLSAGGLLAACGGSSGSSGSGGGGGGTAKSSPPSTGTIKPGGSLKVGATGGGAKDTIDAHLPTADPDIMRCWNLYEPLAVRPPSFGPLEMMVAESIEAEHGKADSWVVKIRPGIEFHNGKSVTADDVIFSLNRILDPKDPEGRRGLDRLHRHQGPQEDLELPGPDPAEVRQRRVPRRPRPVLQRDRPDQLRPQEPGRHGRVHVREFLARPAERVQEVPQLLAERPALRGPAHDHRLHR